MLMSPSATLGPASNATSAAAAATLPAALFRRVGIDGTDSIHGAIWPDDDAENAELGTRVLPLSSASSSSQSSEEDIAQLQARTHRAVCA